MPLYTQSIKNLKGGISQQPDILRFQDQGEKQVNCWSSESEGLQKRPPTVWTKRIGGTDYLGPAPKFHLINRDEFEQYYLVFTGSTVKVFGLDGTEYAVSGDMSYVQSASPRDNIRVVTVADYTFITNRGMITAKGSTQSYAGYNSKNRALINLRGGQYGRTLRVSINNGPEVAYALPAGNDAEKDPPKVDAQAFGAELVTLLSAAYGSYGVTFTLGSGYIVIKAPDGVNVTDITTKDGYGNTLITGMIDTVQTVSKLPLAAPDGYLMKISGETGSSADEYWIVYNSESKTWSETNAPNTLMDFNASTMPHALVRQSDGSFSLQTLDWAKRGAGDDDTNPYPSFIESTINDVFFYRNRLGFLSGENIIMSRPAGYFQFFPKSVATLSDDDPIDVAVSNPRISVLKYAIPFAEQLLLWSDEVQFVMTSAGTMTAKSVQLDTATAFTLSDAARPFAVGRSVFFCNPRGSFTSINRYFAVQDVTDVKDADDITGHVLSYIPNGVFDIQGTATESFLTVLTTGAKQRVYIYKFLFKDSVQLQASWSHWEFESDVEVLAASVIGSTLYLVKKTLSGVDMETVSFIKETTDFAGEPYRIHVDSKVQYQTPSTYDIYEARTTLNLTSIYGSVPNRGSYYFLNELGAYILLDEPVGGWESNPTVYLSGDWSNQRIFVGRMYTMDYKFSRFLIKQEDQNGTVTIDTGRLQLRRAWINYQDTGALQLESGGTGRQTFVNTLNGKPLGRGVIGEVNIGTGQYRFPLNGDAKVTELSLKSYHPNPVSIVGCGWEASYAIKAKKI